MKIKELTGVESEEKLYEKFPWLKSCDFEYAVIEVTESGIVWYGGVWRGGVWVAGEWHDGEWQCAVPRSKGIWDCLVRRCLAWWRMACRRMALRRNKEKIK